MKILLVNNFYGTSAPSGENTVFVLERAMLEARGHELRCFERHSDDLRRSGVSALVKAALLTPWNPFAAHQFKALLNEFRPDIVHVHNTFPMISPAIFSAARGFPRVMTLHNYRIVCPAAIPMRAGKACTLCIDGRSSLPALRHGCYRNSRLATLPLAAKISLHRMRGTWTRDVDAYIALSRFQRDLMIDAGFPGDRISVKPNFTAPNERIAPLLERPERAIFIGRLSPEKGVETLVAAWIAWGAAAPELLIVGDGPSRCCLEAQVRHSGLRQIRFVGNISRDEVQRQLALSRLVILPSIWFETFGMAVVEGMAAGTPALVSDAGPLPELVAGGSGDVFRAGDSNDLLRQARRLWADPSRLSMMSGAARDAYRKRFSEEDNYRSLMSIYGRVARTGDALSLAGGFT
jgi:glycosyltransferase involved in cell wall biosynthesis